MSFFKTATIYLNRHKICLLNKNKLACVDVPDSAWPDVFIEQLVEELAKTLKKHRVDVIVDDTLCYLKIMRVAKKHSSESIRKEALKKIPEKLSAGSWHYKIVDKEKEIDEIQFFAVNEELVQKFAKFCNLYDINITCIRPLAYLAAQLFKSSQPQLIYYSFANQRHLCLQKSGAVVWSTYLPQSDTRDQSSQIIDQLSFIEKVFNFKVRNVLVNKDFLQNVIAQIPELKSEVKPQSIASSPAIKDSPNQHPDQVCVIDASKMTSFHLDEKNMLLNKTPTVSGNQLRSMILIIIAALLYGVAVTILVIYLMRTNDKQTQLPKYLPEKQESASILSPVPLPSPSNALNDTADQLDQNADSDSNIEPQNFFLRIENGSGIAGEASKLEKSLQAVGFINITTQNAEQSNYQATQIIGEDVNLVEYVSNLLQTDYDIETTIKDMSAEKVDVLIVVGRKKTR